MKRVGRNWNVWHDYVLGRSGHFVGWKRWTFLYACILLWKLEFYSSFLINIIWYVCPMRFVPFMIWEYHCPDEKLLLTFRVICWWNISLNGHPLSGIILNLAQREVISLEWRIAETPIRWYLLLICYYLRVRVSVMGCWWRLPSTTVTQLKNIYLNVYELLTSTQTLFSTALHHYHFSKSVSPGYACNCCVFF